MYTIRQIRRSDRKVVATAARKTSRDAVRTYESIIKRLYVNQYPQVWQTTELYSALTLDGKYSKP